MNFHWLVAHQANVNIYNRINPYYWVFDPLLDPAEYVRPLPPWATVVSELDLYATVTPKHFPPPEGKRLY